MGRETFSVGTSKRWNWPWPCGGEKWSHRSRIENTFVGAQSRKTWRNNLAFKHNTVSHVNSQKKSWKWLISSRTHFPEVVHLAVYQRLVLPLDVIDVLDVAGVQVLLHHEAQEAVIWSVSCGVNTTTNQTSQSTRTWEVNVGYINKTWFLPIYEKQFKESNMWKKKTWIIIHISQNSHTVQ